MCTGTPVEAADNQLDLCRFMQVCRTFVSYWIVTCVSQLYTMSTMWRWRVGKYSNTGYKFCTLYNYPSTLPLGTNVIVLDIVMQLHYCMSQCKRFCLTGNVHVQHVPDGLLNLTWSPTLIASINLPCRDSSTKPAWFGKVMGLTFSSIGGLTISFNFFSLAFRTLYVSVYPTYLSEHCACALA